MRLPYEAIKKYAEAAGRAGEGNALVIVDMDDGVTGVTVSGDTMGALWGMSRAIMRMVELADVPYEAFLDIIADMCKKVPVDEDEVLIKGELLKRGAN